MRINRISQSEDRGGVDVGSSSVIRLAKQAVKRTNVDMHVKLLKSEGKSIIWRELGEKWQQYWDGESKGRHLHKVQNKIRRDINRKEEKRTSHYEQNENWTREAE